MTTPEYSPQEYLRQSLAASATYRALVGAETAAQALRTIHDDEIPPPADGTEYSAAELAALFPCAVLWEESWSHLTVATDAVEESGVVGLVIHFPVTSVIAGSARAISATVRNLFRGITTDLENSANTPGCLHVDKVTMRQPWERTRGEDVESIGDVVLLTLSVEWN